MPNMGSTDVTEKALSQRLLKEAGNAPVTLGTTVSSILFGASAVLFTGSEWFVMLAGFAGLSLIGLSGYLLKKTVFGRHKEMMRIIEKVREETMLERKAMMVNVKKSLTEQGDSHGLTQLSQLDNKFSTFTKILDMQFDRDELTHKRYLTVAEQLYFGAIDNLKNVATLRFSMAAIDRTHLSQSLAANDLDDTTREAMQKRLEIYRQAESSVADTLTRNEQVMTKLDEVTGKLSSIQTRAGLSTLKLDSAMREIKHLIGRVEQYDKTN